MGHNGLAWRDGAVLVADQDGICRCRTAWAHRAPALALKTPWWPTRRSNSVSRLPHRLASE